ncbi:uncharacterized protein LOC100678822 isoform X1 [Nasonia vitripennis]|uniref:Selenoprotein P N-terminal domain-containing protein n=2 Tax=Nasonia vitripennis TaxID=7425 RepID=A0A7M7IW22_NASVI|nr:uncharacterized protein LOC100678822 isoform X1 [Nasonia vitripennis]
MKMRLIIFLLTALWYDSSSFGHVQAEPKSSNTRLIPKRFNSRLWKRQDDLGYLEQCSILQFWDKQIGRVNVLAFFDSSWQFSHRQAAMLKVLRERFDKTGFDNIQFFAINASPDESQYIDRAEVEVEEETWKQISPSEAEGRPPVVVSPEALIEALGPDVYFIQDNDELQIWSKLRAFRDQILVIDRCGRLTYQVIVPWSILHFPYVKAAILSTYKDEPCGYCQFKETVFDTTSTDNKDAQSSSKLVEQTEDNDNPSTLSQETTTVIYEAESYDTTLTVDESSSPIVQTEHEVTSLSTSDRNDGNETSSVSQESEDLQMETDDGQAPSTIYQESSTLSDLVENSESSSKARESTTDISQINDGEEQSTYFHDSSTPSYPDESNNTESISEDQSTPNIQTEADSTFDTSTYLYSPTLPDSNENESANSTDNKDAEDYYNSTPDKEFEYTTENVETPATDEALITDTTDGLEFNNATDQLISEVEVQTTTDISNSSSETGESRLKDSDEIESRDARDVLKSRSTNARSVSPNDGSENHLEIVNINENNQETLESDFLIPIRIIMRAPHVDEYSDQTMKAHEYLVLKTGQADYHEHLDEPKPDDNEEEHRPVRKKAEAVRRTFGKDESPGFYGEVADYWRNFGNEQLTQSSAEEEEQDLEDYTDDGVTLSPTTLSLNDERINVENQYDNPEVVPIGQVGVDDGTAYDHNSDLKEEVDVVDEEAKSKLIAHYSKLLPWLYYVLAK